MKSILPTLFIYALLVLGCNARTLHVNPDGNDTHDGLTPETALRTPQRAADRAEPGDTILLTGEFFADGHILLEIRRSGEPDRPIVFTSAPGQQAVFRTRNTWHSIFIEGASHIVIADLRLIGHAEEVTLEEAQSEMNNLHNPRTSGNGIGISANSEPWRPSSHITVRDCIISDFPGGGLYMRHSDHVLFEGNIIFNNSFWAPYANSGISIYQPIDVDEDTESYKIIIQRNITYGNFNKIPFYFSNREHPEKRTFTDGNGIILDDYFSSQDFGGGISKPYLGRTLVANNIAFNNGGSGIHAFLCNNIDIFHNLAYGNNTHPVQSPLGQIFFNKCESSRALNNILISPVNKPVNSNWNNKVDVVYNHNLYADEEGGTPTFTQALRRNIVAPSGLVMGDWSLHGDRAYHFAEDSPVLRLGKSLPEVPTDFFGQPFPTEGPRPAGPFAAEWK
jgi:hypothetical protein